MHVYIVLCVLVLCGDIVVEAVTRVPFKTTTTIHCWGRGVEISSPYYNTAAT